MTTKFISASALFFGAFLLATSSVAAAGTGTIYGGGYGGYGGYGYGNNPSSTGKKITLDKKVKNPSTGTFVDHLSVNDPKHSADQEITFQITLKNTGGVELKDITVKDVIPQYLTLTTSGLSFDKNTKTYSIKVASLPVNETKVIELKGKIASANQLPVDDGIFCLINQAVVTLDDTKVQDNAQFCVQRQVVGKTKGGLPIFAAATVKKTPDTGAFSIALLSFPLLSTLGVFLRRKSA